MGRAHLCCADSGNSEGHRVGVACLMPESAWLCHNMDEPDRWGPDQGQAEWEVASVGFLRMTPPRTCACIFDLLPAAVQGRAPCHWTTPPIVSPLHLHCRPPSASHAVPQSQPTCSLQNPRAFSPHSSLPGAGARTRLHCQEPPARAQVPGARAGPQCSGAWGSFPASPLLYRSQCASPPGPPPDLSAGPGWPASELARAAARWGRPRAGLPAGDVCRCSSDSLFELLQWLLGVSAWGRVV